MAAQTNAFKSPFRNNSDSSLQPVNYTSSHFKTNRIGMGPNGSRYQVGQKRCSMCSEFLAVESLRCPCCGAILRTKSRSKKAAVENSITA